MSAAVGIAGIGLWSPTCQSATAWVQRQSETELAVPRGGVLPAMQRRRASALTRAALDAAVQAAAGLAGEPLNLAMPAVVFGSAWGETSALGELLSQLREPGSELSPTRFAASVHNAGIGQLSIATGQQGFATSLAAGEATLAMALFEAQSLLASGEKDVLLVVADAEPPNFLSSLRCSPFAVAVWLTASVPHGAPALGPLEQGVMLPMQGDIPVDLQQNPCRFALALVDAVLGGRVAHVALGASWSVTVTPAMGAA